MNWRNFQILIFFLNASVGHWKHCGGPHVAHRPLAHPWPKPNSKTLTFQLWWIILLHAQNMGLHHMLFKQKYFVTFSLYWCHTPTCLVMVTMLFSHYKQNLFTSPLYQSRTWLESAVLQVLAWFNWGYLVWAMGIDPVTYTAPLRRSWFHHSITKYSYVSLLLQNNFLLILVIRQLNYCNF